ncbi:MAG TPA: hypothetical protein VGJ19_13220 [Streptosporangiaceae bacterium]|jgi:hypothetical protein
MPDQPDRDDPEHGTSGQNEPARPAAGHPVARPEQSAEDTDTGWGERPDPDDDERFSRDRPPHWGSD